MSNTILNIAGGKIDPIGLISYEPYFLVNVDTMYYSSLDPAAVEVDYRLWKRLGSGSCKVKEDIFTFMERTTLSFNRVCIYRYLEHVPMDKVLYFIYLLSTVTTRGSTIDVIVPNYKTLATMILEEEQRLEFGENFEQYNIELTTELLNEPSSPHASIWTNSRAEYFFTLEQRFNIIEMKEDFSFDGRDIYLRFIAERV